MNTPINNLQNNPEGKNSSMQAKVKAGNQESLVQALSSDQWERTNVNPRDSIDFDTYITANPNFQKFNFSEEDIQYLRIVEERLLEDPHSKTANQITWEIPPERLDLAEVVFGYILPRVLRIKS